MFAQQLRHVSQLLQVSQITRFNWFEEVSLDTQKRKWPLKGDNNKGDNNKGDKNKGDNNKGDNNSIPYNHLYEMVEWQSLLQSGWSLHCLSFLYCTCQGRPLCRKLVEWYMYLMYCSFCYYFLPYTSFWLFSCDDYIFCIFLISHYWLESHHSRISLCISHTGTSKTAGARNKGGNFIGQLCISVVPHWSVT